MSEVPFPGSVAPPPTPWNSVEPIPKKAGKTCNPAASCREYIAKALREADEREVEVALDYLEISSWFGTCSLLSVFLFSGEKEKLKNCCKNFFSNLNPKLWLDMFLLFGVTLLQPLLYAFFMWAALMNLEVDLVSNVNKDFCPTFYNYSGEFNLPVIKASASENGFYVLLLLMYNVQLFSEISGAALDIPRSRWGYCCCCCCCGIRRAEGSGSVHRLRNLRDFYPVSAAIDQFFHVFGLLMLIGASMVAMFWQSGVGAMTLNATAVFFLEQLDDGLKLVMLKRHRNVVKQQLNKAPCDVRLCSWSCFLFWVSTYFTILACLLAWGFSLFLVAETFLGCKPSVEVLNLFG